MGWKHPQLSVEGYEAKKYAFDPWYSVVVHLIFILDDMIYQLWQGIITYFKPDGFLTKHHIPSCSSLDYDERCTIYVTQNFFLNKSTAITQFLILIREDWTA